jgi:hypothetical protein
VSATVELPSLPGVRRVLVLSPGDVKRPKLRRHVVALALVALLLALLAVVAAARVLAPSAEDAGTGVAGPPRSSPATGDDTERPHPRAPQHGAPRASETAPASARVVAPAHATALFAPHSWYLPAPPAPPPPPAVEPPPPEPTAPPFPYTFVGSYAPEGEPPVFFLARGDRVIDARVGDRLDGVYQFESAAGGQLVFVYLPLNIRQSVGAGASR